MNMFFWRWMELQNIVFILWFGGNGVRFGIASEKLCTPCSLQKVAPLTYEASNFTRALEIINFWSQSGSYVIRGSMSKYLPLTSNSYKKVGLPVATSGQALSCELKPQLLITTIILHLTNYGQKKSTNKPDVSAGRRDITVWVESAGRRLCKNRNFY
jgi:hypothetical protein